MDPLFSKYFVGKVEDAQQYLSKEEQQTLAELMGKLAVARAAAGKPQHRYVVLNLVDPFAREAIDSYINAVESSSLAGGPARATAVRFREVLQLSRLQDTERLPD